MIQSFNYDGGQYYNNQHYRICILTSSKACQIEFVSDGAFMLEKWGNFKTNPYTRAGVTSQYCVKVLNQRVKDIICVDGLAQTQPKCSKEKKSNLPNILTFTL